MILSAPVCLHAFPIRRAGLIDVPGDGCRANERHGPHERVREQRIDRGLIAVDDVENARRQTRLSQ